ncbi:hypothetical protein RDABS01_031673 [Bienertia sinuspersici]
MMEVKASIKPLVPTFLAMLLVIAHLTMEVFAMSQTCMFFAYALNICSIILFPSFFI